MPGTSQTKDIQRVYERTLDQRSLLLVPKKMRAWPIFGRAWCRRVICTANDITENVGTL